MNAAKAVRRAIENQAKGLGFSLIEILSPCPTIWKLTPVEAQKRIQELEKTFPLGVTRDRTKEAQPRPAPKPAPPVADIPKLLGIGPDEPLESARDGKAAAALEPPTAGRGGIDPGDVRIKIAGFGGQGVLLLGEVLAEAGLIAGRAVSWLPSYGPEMRSGTSNCHVRISGRAVDSPMVSRPNILIAMNEPSLAKFLDTIQPGGWLFYNGSGLPAGSAKPDANVVALPFTEMADELGDSRAANIMILGAVTEATGILSNEQVDASLVRHVKSQKWLDLDRQALERGRKAFRERNLA
jgi:2-oxoisovalerate ferredoxin oxidoreductase beta subunit